MKLRIVNDNYSGYEVQIWRWYWPFWMMPGYSINTFRSVSQAEEYANKIKNPVVKYL